MAANVGLSVDDDRRSTKKPVMTMDKSITRN
jgi:hypothetical protein